MNSSTQMCRDKQVGVQQNNRQNNMEFLLPKEPSFFPSHTDVENFYWTFFVHNNLMFNFGQI